MLTFLVLGGLVVLGLAGYANVGDEMRAVFEYVGLWTQMTAFAKGIVDTHSLVYALSIVCPPRRTGSSFRAAEHRVITARFRQGIATVLTGYIINTVFDVLADLTR